MITAMQKTAQQIVIDLNEIIPESQQALSRESSDKLVSIKKKAQELANHELATSPEDIVHGSRLEVLNTISEVSSHFTSTCSPKFIHDEELWHLRNVAENFVRLMDRYTEKLQQLGQE